LFFKTIRNKIKNSWEYLFFFLVPIFMLLLYIVIINVESTRYLFPYLSLGLISGVIFFDKFTWGKKYLYIISFISVITSISLLANGPEIISSLILFIVLVLLIFIFRKKMERTAAIILNLKFLFCFFIIMIAILFVLNNNYNRKEFSRYPGTFSKKESSRRDIAFAWQWLNKDSGSGAKVGYAGRTEIYPLFGSKLKNEVMYVPINKISMSPYDSKDGFYRKEMNYTDWVSNLENFSIDYLFIALPEEINSESGIPGSFPIEDKWALEHPELFSQVFKNSLVHIYKVNL